MKIINLLLCIFVANIILSSCSEDKAVRDMLDEADRLLVGKSDSALLLLDSYEKDSEGFSRAQRMRYEMLRALAQNSEDVLFSSDSIILEVVDYYNSHGSDHDRMRANYALGSVYRDLGDAPTAIQYYNDAVSYADTTSLSCDFRTLSRIYGQMASLFHSQRTPALEQEYQRKAVDAAWKARDTVSALIFEDHIADAFVLMNNADSALFYLEQAHSKFLQKGLMNLAGSILPTAIGIYMDQNRYEKASEAISFYEKHSGFFYRNGEIMRGKEGYYSLKGRYYEGTNKLDSALIYYRKLLAKQHNRSQENRAYSGLMSVYLKQNNADSAVYYAAKYGISERFLSVERSSDDIIKNQAIYNYALAQRQKDQAIIESLRIKNYLTIFVLITILLITIGYIYFKNVQRDRAEKTRRYDALIRMYDRSKKDLDSALSDFEGYRQKKIEEIEQLQTEIETLKDKTSLLDGLHEKAKYGTIALDSELADLEDYVRITDGKFYDFVTSKENGLSKFETSMSLLIRCSFSAREIAFLLGLSSQRTTNLREKINLKLFDETSAKTVDVNIKRLFNTEEIE